MNCDSSYFDSFVPHFWISNYHLFLFSLGHIPKLAAIKLTSYGNSKTSKSFKKVIEFVAFIFHSEKWYLSEQNSLGFYRYFIDFIFILFLSLTLLLSLSFLCIHSDRNDEGKFKDKEQGREGIYFSM